MYSPLMITAAALLVGCLLHVQLKDVYSQALTTCPYYPGYHGFPNTDHQLADIYPCRTIPTLEETLANCTRNPVCKSVNGGSCIKYLSNPTRVFVGWCLWTKDCPQTPGYVALYDVDEVGNNYGPQVVGYYAALANCSATPSCVGVNSFGWEKTSVATAVSDPARTMSSPGSCLYVKAVTNCISRTGYFAFANVDHAGDEIATGATLDASMIACNAAGASCSGFTSLGSVKSAVQPLVTSPRTCLYARSCPTIEGYLLTPNRDYPGDVLPQPALGLHWALYLCNANPSCKGFHSGGWLKDNLNPTKAVNTAGLCFYTKGITSCNTYDNYVSFANMDHAADTRFQLATEGAAAANCSGSTSSVCAGFNSFGFTKTYVFPMAVATGACLYVRDCPALEGYTAVRDVDHAGDNLGPQVTVGGLPEALSKCNADAACKGFNSFGWLKSAAAFTSSAPGMCFYRKNVLGCYAASYDRGSGVSANCPADHPVKYPFTKCFTQCGDGDYDVAYSKNYDIETVLTNGSCWSACPSGSIPDSSTCRTGLVPYTRQLFVRSSNADCANQQRYGQQYTCEPSMINAADWVPVCKSGYHPVVYNGTDWCFANCPYGLTDLGISEPDRDANMCSRQTYMRNGVNATCADISQQETSYSPDIEDATCYTKCKPGFDAYGRLCWGACPATYPYHCGAGLCTVDANACSEASSAIGGDALDSGVLPMTYVPSSGPLAGDAISTCALNGFTSLTAAATCYGPAITQAVGGVGPSNPSFWSTKLAMC